MDFTVTPTDHLSPPSTTSRLSDSDTFSEYDGDGLIIGRDGTSISSLGSSSSEVKVVESFFKHKPTNGNISYNPTIYLHDFINIT